MRAHPTSASRFKAVLALAAAVGVFGAVPAASAHEEFPGVILEHYPKLACPPQCSLCHLSSTGGGALRNETVDKYTGPHQGYGSFVMNMMAMPGGVELTEANIPGKLLALEKTPCNTDAARGDITDMGICDSDGDGTADYLEVGVGEDPNVKGPGNGAVCPKYGCGASSIGSLPRRSSDAGHAAAAMAGLGVALILGRRLRRRA